ncbi:MAG: PEP-CTERM sorting domain-containing protein [Trichodesmium sp.]
MKNLETNTQVSARNLFTSCLCGLSSAVLASSFALFAPAPEAAVAATLIDSDGDEIVDGVKDLAVGDKMYDVEFLWGDAAYAVFDSDSSPIDGFAAVSLAEFLWDHSIHKIQDDIWPISSRQINVYDLVSGMATAIDLTNHLSLTPTYWPADTPHMIAKFSEREEIPASTPEPSQVLGFITLGGLMLGSKRKTKA